MTTREEKLEELVPVILSAARTVENQWPGVADADDLQQEITIKLLESPSSLDKVFESERRLRFRILIRIGHQIASQERADYDYYKGSYRYSVEEAKSVLSKGILIEPLDGGFDEVVFDLMEALEVLATKNPGHSDAITKRYADEVIPTESAEKMVLSRALTSLVGEMNKSHSRRFSERDSGPGSRSVVSSEFAQEQLGKDWDGED
ncbi:MAG: hypothetical protein EON54_07515 [Alcaligenaceae bacterium]|nr:MAG: hypothetical protein EON54_07515 [Alcaligenaceae bacterium]